MIDKEIKTLKKKAREIFYFKYVTQTTYHTDVVEKIEWIDEFKTHKKAFKTKKRISKTICVLLPISKMNTLPCIDRNNR